ncbi:MAG: metallophosphoesterase [Lachnospiraceae bacterium]|nr:metallophosphoesterase [Lachnospiraceae bacterium]
MEKQYSWLQLSDLHIFESTDWNIMQREYESLAEVVKPDFIVVTGDFRHKTKQPSYAPALSFLNKIVNIFGVKKECVFLVPGNHDVNDYQYRKEIIASINTEISKNADAYKQYMDNGPGDLHNAFCDYCSFVRSFYGDEVSDDRYKTPSDLICIPYQNKLNIIILNTALIASGVPTEKQIVDIKKFSEIIFDKKLPSIVLAHHDISSLHESHQRRVISILNAVNARAYLCGDKHVIEKNGVDKSNVPNTSIPVIVCGKSTIEMTDTFSKLCVIEYTCCSDGNTTVQVYRYQGNGFIQAPDFYYSVNKKFSFHMYDQNELIKSNAKKPRFRTSKKGTQHNGTTKKPQSIWLPDAELAKGKQTRFTSFTNTEAVNKYFDPDSAYLGVISVKGIGKTFLLQVKRVKSSHKFYCLPECPRPSVKNNWATERIVIDRYSVLKTDNPFDDLVLLWKVAIKCYVVCNLHSEDNLKEIDNYIHSGKLSDEIARLCNRGRGESLNSIFGNILEIPEWNKEIAKYHNSINNLCRLLLRRRKKDHSSKDIAIFIDKVDQAITQTNAEPPADCVVCKKKNNYIECTSSRKGTAYCSSESGCQSKNCCYGCEIFASPESNDGLRIYEHSNAYKRTHVNIWQYFQLALMSAAGQISDEFNGEISVFFTIRQEAFHCEDARLGEQNQKVAGRVIRLQYTFDEQKQIFIDCIRSQDPTFLFQPSSLSQNGREEFAFVGIDSLCHPYCTDATGNKIKESLFTCIYRHSFDRSRDIQRYGEQLTKNMNRIRSCKDTRSREEFVKQLIEDLAASLAYCSKQSESTVNPSYYTEKLHYLPNYWADSDNFEKLLSLIDRNLLFEDDIKRICRIVNGHYSCPESGCRGGECKRQPFSMLYNMGYLGYIVQNPSNANDEIQHFLDASDISYFTESDDLITADRVAYIVHPALSKAIEKKYNKGFMHFSGFILGKGLTVETRVLMQMLDDRKTLEMDSFVRKYYFKP